MSLAKRLHLHPATQRALALTRRHKSTAALMIAVFASLVLVAASVAMYYLGGFHRYDLSRPGFEKERAELAKPEPQKAYDTTSPVTQTTAADFLKEFDGRQQDLGAYGSFRDLSLSDEDLQIAPNTE